MTDESHDRPAGEGARERILRAAIGLISEHGADRVTHRLAAEAAQVSPGTVTYHFETRGEIVRYAFDLYMDDYAAGLDAALEARPITTLEEVTRFLATLTTLSPEDADLARLEYEMISHAQRDANLYRAVGFWAGLLPARITVVLDGLDVPAPERTAQLLIAICRGTEADVLSRGYHVPFEVFQARLLAVLTASL